MPPRITPSFGQRAAPSLLVLLLALLPGAARAQHNYAAAFQQALYWYEAQTSGATPLDHRVEWRGDSALRDGSDVGRDLTGGWYDAGDGVVWTSNDAFGASMLAWSLVRDRDVYISTGQYQRAIDRLREINAYFEKIIQLDANGAIQRIYVGKGTTKDAPPDDPAVTNDRTALLPHEVMDAPVGGASQMIRPSYWVDSSTGGADVAGQLSAALAASSIAFRDYGDLATSEALLARARLVFAWGQNNPNASTATRRLTNGAIVTLANYSVRSATWTPRMIYGAAWLHRAELRAATPGYAAAYADLAETLYASAGNADDRNKSWLSHAVGDPQMGAYAILAADTGRSVFVTETNAYANFWAYRRANDTGLATDITLTPGGFLARNRPSATNGGGWNNHYLFDQAPPLLDWAASSFNTNATQKTDLRNLFKNQLPYVLGSNPYGKSYLQGYDSPALPGAADWFNNAHYRASLAAYGGFGAGAPAVNAYPCYGLLFPGPGHTDEYPDTETAISSGIHYKEPIIYSGGLLTVLAQRIRDDGVAASVPAVFPPWIDRGPDYQTRAFFVEAYREDGVVTNGTRLQISLNNRASLPAREINTLAFRYYFTPDGVAGTAYTSSATGLGLLSGETISVHGPSQVGSSATWFFEYRFNNACIVPGEYSRYRRRAQITIQQSGGAFSLANDHSGAALSATASYVTIANLPVYDFAAGKLLGGFEPSAGYIQWRRAHFNNVLEKAPALALVAERVGGSSGAVSATVTLSSGSATAGADFTLPADLVLSWAAGETGEKTLLVPLVQDAYDEGRHSFTATLGSLAGGAQAGLLSTARASIEDDDFGGPPDPGGLVQLLGNSTLVADGDSSPSLADHTDFGSAEVDYEPERVTRTFTLRNLDSAPLALSGAPRVVLAGAHAADFTVLAEPPASIPAGGSATVQIRFAPSALGLRNATVSIPNSRSLDGAYDFAIAGTGRAPGPVAQLPSAGFVFSLAPGAPAATATIPLQNLGRGTLAWSAALGANYLAQSSTAPGGPAYEWIDIDATGTQLFGSGNADDELGTAFTLPFAFPFYGSSKTQAKVSTNGFLTFNPSANSSPYFNSTLPASDPLQAILPWWDDLYVLGGTSKILWRQTDPDTVVISWNNLTYFAWRSTAATTPSQRFSFQLHLKRNGDIVCHYKDVVASPDSNRYTIGLAEANDSARSLQYAYNLPSAEAGVALRFLAPSRGAYDPAGAAADWAAVPAPGSGNVAANGTANLALLFDPAGLVSGQSYRTTLTLSTNDPAQASVQVPVLFTVSGLYDLAASDAANRAWDGSATWSPSVAAGPGPADRWQLARGGGSLDLRGSRTLGDVAIATASALAINGQGLGGNGSGSSLTLAGSTTIHSGGLLASGWGAALRVRGPLVLAGGSFGLGSGSNGSVLVDNDVPLTFSGGALLAASTYQSVHYTASLGAGDLALSPATASTIDIPVALDWPLARRLVGSGTLTKTGTGTVLLQGENSAHTGALVVSAGAVRLAGQDVFGDAATLRLAGGSFQAAGRVETLGPLDLDAPSSIDLSGGPSALSFADSSAQAWSGALAITGHAPGRSVRVGASGSALTAAQLAAITIDGQPAALSPDGYLAPASTPLAAWRWTHFGTTADTGSAASTADPDADGLSNLLEYAFATDPKIGGSFQLPSLQVSGLSPQPAFLQLTFLRARAELSYEVLASSDLVTWSVIATNPGAVSLTAPVTVTDPESLSTHPRRFLRLRVTLP